jgi:diadenosine tetraphosphate (Ap4A) HIT family hydrolase
MATIFEKIIARELPADILFENGRLIAIRDAYPVAPVHLLIIPKKVIPSLGEMEKEDFPLLSEVGELAQHLAREQGVADGYRLLTNVGADAGQTIFHLHFHLIGGRKLGSLA